MSRCTNKVTQYVPKGWDYKAVEMNCGNTGIDGQRLECAACAKATVKRGHGVNECKHGVNVYDSFCGRCEFD